ncbi:MAG: hypothetical protein ACLS9Q_15265 [[Clostridium] scindens]|uniref:hypothetical protein n=1 Tax=Clostridium scindens (strain JCM 10418 / VPI 12708) TaxID=29347 RepID=UPI003992EB98
MSKFSDTLEYLGSDYSVKNIDYEDCIYKKIGNLELEISGLHSRGKYDATIYLHENGRITKSISDIHSKEELAKHLETLV